MRRLISMRLSTLRASLRRCVIALDASYGGNLLTSLKKNGVIVTQVPLAQRERATSCDSSNRYGNTYPRWHASRIMSSGPS